MAEHSNIPSASKYSATRRDRRRSRTQIYAYEGQDPISHRFWPRHYGDKACDVPAALSQSQDHLRSRRRGLLSESSSHQKSVSGRGSMELLVTSRNVTKVLRSSDVTPYDLPEHKSGSSNTRDTPQPLLQFESPPTIDQAHKDETIPKLESIDRSVSRHQLRCLKRSYQEVSQNPMVTKTLGMNDHAIASDLRLSTDREGNFRPTKTARQYRGLQNSAGPIVGPRISLTSPVLAVTPNHGSLAPMSKNNASHLPVNSRVISSTERHGSLPRMPRLRRTSSSGTTIFTPPLIVTASPNSEKSGCLQGSSSDSSDWSKEQMSFL